MKDALEFGLCECANESVYLPLPSSVRNILFILGTGIDMYNSASSLYAGSDLSRAEAKLCRRVNK